MPINKFFVPANELTDVGLQEIKMLKLGCFVALAGKNGSGKSRILNKLDWYSGQRNDYTKDSANIDRNILTYRERIHNLPDDDLSQANSHGELNRLSNQRTIASERIISNITPAFGVLHFLPKKLELVDSRQSSKASLQGYYDSAKSSTFEHFHSLCFSYIQKVQDRQLNVTHPNNSFELSIKQEAVQEYENLNSLLKLLLQAELGRTIDDDVTLFGKPLADTGLSDGQKVLIQLAVALHAQKGKLDNTVFILDEPENHLHPSVVIEFLEKLTDIAKSSQFWIATHSVPLLAYIAHKEPMSIWYVEDGKVSNAGSKPEQVLQGLLGDDEQIGNLSAFTSLPAQFATVRFAMECLTNPKVSANGKGDHQVAQIGNLLDFSASSVKSVLDYGAGKCRLLQGLAEIAEERGRILTDLWSYFAYEPSPENKEYNLEIINSIYGDSENRIFLNQDEFFNSKEDKSIDVVIMCNVMHEIIPNEWLTLFNKDSLIYRSLKDSGSVLIVEDQRIPVGEKAHKFGFLVLDSSHLRTLFSIKDDDCKKGLFEVFDYRNDARLKAHKISKEILLRIDAESRKCAINGVLVSAKEKIKKLREAKPDYKNGQLHGFWTQQFANASLWLDEH